MSKMASEGRKLAAAKREAMNGNANTENDGPSAKSAKKHASKISMIFEALEYGPAPESAEIAKNWIAGHDGLLGHFINGKWVKPKGREQYDSFSPATGKV